jgi:hypothetical protein
MTLRKKPDAVSKHSLPSVGLGGCSDFIESPRNCFSVPGWELDFSGGTLVSDEAYSGDLVIEHCYLVASGGNSSAPRRRN